MKISALVVLSSVLLSCKQAPPLAAIQYRVDDMLLETVVERVITLDPQANSITFPTSFHDYGDFFTLMDPASAMRCFVFNADGSLRFELGKSGQGPGEYLMPTALTFANERFFLVSGADKRINVYDRQGRYLHQENRDFDGIVMSLHPYGKGAIGGVFSRYCDYSIFVLDQEGRKVQSFSPTPEAMRYTFENLWPGGDVLVEEGRILEFFNYKYEIKIFDLEGTPLETLKLASTRYKEPDLEVVKGLKGDKERRMFKTTYTPVSGLFAYKDGYITRLTVYDEHEESKEILEFWDRHFNGYGYMTLGDEHFLGVRGESLAFFNFADQKNEITYRSLVHDMKDNVGLQNE